MYRISSLKVKKKIVTKTSENPNDVKQIWSLLTGILLLCEMVAEYDKGPSHLLKLSFENDSCIVDSWENGISLNNFLVSHTHTYAAFYYDLILYSQQTCKLLIISCNSYWGNWNLESLKLLYDKGCYLGYEVFKD